MAASVLAVAVVAAGIGIWQGRYDEGISPANARMAVQVKTPAAWRSALHAGPIRIDGKPVRLAVVTPSGATVVTVGGHGDKPTAIALVDSSGSARTLYRAPAGQWVSGVRSKGRWLVFALQRNVRAAALPARYVHRGTGYLSYEGRSETGQKSFLASITDNFELLRRVVYFIAEPPRCIPITRVGCGIHAVESTTPDRRSRPGLRVAR